MCTVLKVTELTLKVRRCSAGDTEGSPSNQTKAYVYSFLHKTLSQPWTIWRVYDYFLQTESCRVIHKPLRSETFSVRGCAECTSPQTLRMWLWQTADWPCLNTMFARWTTLLEQSRVDAAGMPAGKSQTNPILPGPIEQRSRRSMDWPENRQNLRALHVNKIATLPYLGTWACEVACAHRVHYLYDCHVALIDHGLSFMMISPSLYLFPSLELSAVFRAASWYRCCILANRPHLVRNVPIWRPKIKPDVRPDSPQKPIFPDLSRQTTNDYKPAFHFFVNSNTSRFREKKKMLLSLHVSVFSVLFSFQTLVCCW